jgi:hypothetical protein
MKFGGNVFDVSVNAPSLCCVSAIGPAHTSGLILADRFTATDRSGGQRNSLAYQILSAKQFASRINTPHSWVLDNSNIEHCDDPVPCLPLGGSSVSGGRVRKLVAWIERRVVCPYSIEAEQGMMADYDYLDSAQFAMRLNISESWVRDQVRTRADFKPSRGIRT